MALLLAAVIWGSTFFIIKDATTSLSTAHILALRFAVGAVCLGFLCGRRLGLINRAYIKWGLALGTLTFAAYGVHIYGLELDTTPGKSAFLTSIYCVVVPFVYWLLGRSRPDRFEFGAAALCLVGIGLISLNEGLEILRGDLYTLLSGLLTGVEIVLIAKACQQRDPIVMTFLQLSVVAGLGLMLVFFQAGLPQQREIGFRLVEQAFVGARLFLAKDIRPQPSKHHAGDACQQDNYGKRHPHELAKHK